MSSNPLEHPAGGDENPVPLNAMEPSREGSTRFADPPQASAGNPCPMSLAGDRAFHALFEAAMDALVIADGQGRYRAVNRAACELFGLGQEALLGRCLADFMPPGWERVWPRPGEQTESQGSELRLMRSDGTVREVEYRVTANVLPPYDLLTLRDVTERKQLERQVGQGIQPAESPTPQCSQEEPPIPPDSSASPHLPSPNCWHQEQADPGRSEQLQPLRRLMDALPVCIAYVGRDRHYRYANQTYQTWFNLHPADIIGKPLVEVIGNAAYAEVKPHIDRVLTGESVVYEATMPYAQGGCRYVQGTLVPDVDDQGEIQGCYALVLDWSDRKQAELALQESEALFAAAFQSSPDAILITRLSDGLILDVNAQFVEISGYTRSEAIGQTTLALNLWGDPVERMAIISRLPTEQTIQNYEISFRRKSGERRVGLFSCQLLDLGRQPCVLSVVHDISDRKQAEMILRESETRFLALSDASPANIYILVRRVDGSFYFEYISQAIETIHEIPVQQILEDSSIVLDRIHPEDRAGYDTAAQRSLETLNPFHHEWRVITPSGAVKWLQGNSSPRARDNGEIAWYGVVIDITDLKQAQSALKQQSARERSLRSITQHIRETLDLDDILRTAVTEVQRILQADRTLIFRFASTCSGAIVQEVVHPDYPITLGMQWQGECFSPDCYGGYRDGQVRTFSDLSSNGWSPCLIELMQHIGVQSKMVAPIIQSLEYDLVRLWGWLVVHACGEPRLWHTDEADLLKQVADQLAIAIHQAELYSQVQQLNINLEQQVQDRTADLQQALAFEMLLQRITDQVRDSLDEDQILDAAVRELGLGLQLECCDTGIYNADLTTSTIAHEFTRTLPSAQGVTLTIAEASHWEIYPSLFQGQSVQFCDVIPCPLRPMEQPLTILVCPILDNQSVLGDMWLYKADPFSPAEVCLVQQVAKQCAIALRQSRLYQAAQAQVQELERLNQLKDDFLSTVSHELRTPIASIKMAIQMLEICLQPTALLTDVSQLSSRYFHILKTECQREIQLINDLLDLTHLDAGTEPLTLTLADLRFLIPHLAEPFNEQAEQHQQTFHIAIPDDLPPLMTDLFYLERLVTELLQNACKYTPAGERITLSIHATPAGHRFAISNSGVEIAAPERDRIFDKFYRIPNNDPWKYGGTGLGLALVKKLTERLGGTIHVESGEGQTTFILEFGESP